MKGYTPTLEFSPIKNLSYDIRIGRFIWENGIVQFEDQNGKLHDISKIQFLTRDWNINEGEKHLPKPFKYEDKVLTEKGNLVAYSFISSFEETIIILGSLHHISLKHSEADLTIDSTIYEEFYKRATVKNNEFRNYKILEDGKGNIEIYLLGKEKDQGNVFIGIRGAEKGGQVKLDIDGVFTLNQRDKNGKIINQLLLDNTEGEELVRVIDKHQNIIETNKNGTLIETPKVSIGKDETVKKILIDLLKAIENIQLKHPQAPTMPKGVINQAEFDGIKSRIEEFMTL